MKSGFVSVVGRANVGKSTLMEKILKEKISIISNKPQTTRDQIQIIYNDEESQIIFLDTPGIQTPRNKLQEHLLQVSEESLNDSDIVTFIVDNSREIGRLDAMILDMLKKVRRPMILLINKLDLMEAGDFEYIKKKYENLNLFEKIIGISALNDEHIGEYIEAVKEILPEGPLYYPTDMITNKNERFIVSEIIREKALLNLSSEVPHGIFVRIDEFKKRKDKNLYDIRATIITEKNSHKEIVIGRNGRKIKQIGSLARKEIEIFMDAKVNLQLWVSVEKDWRRKQSMVERFGYNWSIFHTWFCT